MKIWIYWSESNSCIYFYIVLNKNRKSYWFEQSFTGFGPEDRCSSIFYWTACTKSGKWVWVHSCIWVLLVDSILPLTFLEWISEIFWQGDIIYFFHFIGYAVFYLQLFVGGRMSYLNYLYLFAHSGVQHILCGVFVLLRSIKYILASTERLTRAW